VAGGASCGALAALRTIRAEHGEQQLGEPGAAVGRWMWQHQRQHQPTRRLGLAQREIRGQEGADLVAR
jgi:hypothetical protein